MLEISEFFDRVGYDEAGLNYLPMAIIGACRLYHDYKWLSMIRTT